MTDRGQAFTLEGFVGSILLLLAVLLALQAIVITPTTGGLADRTTQAQLQQEAKDTLLVASEDGELSEVMRNWVEEEEGEEEEDDDLPPRFDNTDAPPSPDQEELTYTPGAFAEEAERNNQKFGQVLEDRFEDDGWNYNVELVYHDYEEDTHNSTDMVYQGSAPSDSFTASQKVTLYESDTIEDDDDTELREAHESDELQYPIAPGTSDDDTEVYNVVEVRLTLW